MTSWGNPKRGDAFDERSYASLSSVAKSSAPRSGLTLISHHTCSNARSVAHCNPTFDIPTKRYEHKSVRAGTLRYSASSVFAPEKPHALCRVADHHNLRNQIGWKEIRYTSGCLKTLPPGQYFRPASFAGPYGGRVNVRSCFRN